MRTGENRVDAQSTLGLRAFVTDVAAPALPAARRIDRGSTVSNNAARPLRRATRATSCSSSPIPPTITATRCETRSTRGACTVLTGASSGSASARVRAREDSPSVCAAVARRCARSGSTRPDGISVARLAPRAARAHASSDRALPQSFEPLPAGCRSRRSGPRNQISLGNRGRVDIVVKIHGERDPFERRRPTRATTRYPVVAEVLRRLEAVPSPGSGCPPSARVPASLLSRIKLHLRARSRRTRFPAWCLARARPAVLPGEEPDAGLPRSTEALGSRFTVRRAATLCRPRGRASTNVVKALQTRAAHAIGRPPRDLYRRDHVRRRLRVRSRRAVGDVRTALWDLDTPACSATTLSRSTNSSTRVDLRRGDRGAGARIA